MRASPDSVRREAIGLRLPLKSLPYFNPADYPHLVPADPFSKWVFTTSLKDRERIARLAEARPELSLLDQVRLLAAEG